MTRDELEALIDAGNLKACLSRLEGMPEASAMQLGAAAVARLKAIVKGVRPGSFTWLNRSDDFRLSDVMSEDPWSDTRAKSDVPQDLETFNTARAAVLSHRIAQPVEKRSPLWPAFGQIGLADLARIGV